MQDAGDFRVDLIMLQFSNFIVRNNAALLVEETPWLTVYFPALKVLDKFLKNS